MIFALLTISPSFVYRHVPRSVLRIRVASQNLLIRCDVMILLLWLNLRMCESDQTAWKRCNLCIIGLLKIQSKRIRSKPITICKDAIGVFEVEELVLWRQYKLSATQNVAAKLLPSFQGSFRVSFVVLSPVTYELANLDDTSVSKVHVNDFNPIVCLEYLIDSILTQNS